MPGAFAAVGVALGAGLWLVVENLFWGSADATPAPLQRPSRVLGKVRSLLAEAGHPRVDPVVFLVTVLVLAAGVGVLVVAIVPIPVLSVLSSAAMVLAGFAYLRQQREARFHRLQQAWPGVIDHLRAGIRSGSDVTTALMALPYTLPSEITRPVAEFRANIRRGYDTDTALGELATVLANPVGDRVCEVLRMAHELGGTDLPSVLLQLQQSVRSDIAVREGARAAQSWIRSAALLALGAPWVVLLVIGTREQTLEAYQGLEGTVILVVGAIVSVVAYCMMKSIGALPVASRWIA